MCASQWEEVCSILKHSTITIFKDLGPCCSTLVLSSCPYANASTGRSAAVSQWSSGSRSRSLRISTFCSFAWRTLWRLGLFGSLSFSGAGLGPLRCPLCCSFPAFSGARGAATPFSQGFCGSTPKLHQRSYKVFFWCSPWIFWIASKAGKLSVQRNNSAILSFECWWSSSAK